MGGEGDEVGQMAKKRRVQSEIGCTCSSNHITAQHSTAQQWSKIFK
jgi:hypothetical protein